MTSLRDAIGKPVILRETAEKIGDVQSFAVDAAAHRVTTLVVRSGRNSRLVDWAEVQGIGPDAVIVQATREPTSDDDRTVSGAHDPLNKRVLTDRGNDHGSATDAEVDEEGSVLTLTVGDDSIEGARLRGIGSYAVVVAADPHEA